MPRYTKLNIDDIEDSAPKFGLAPGLEARFGRRPLESEIVAVSRETLAPGFRVPFGHQHRVQEEITRPPRERTDQDRRRDPRPASGRRRPPRPRRPALHRGGTEGLQYLAVGAPVSDEDDRDRAGLVERLTP